MQPDAADPKDSLTYVNGLFFGRASSITQKGGLGAIFQFGVTADVPPQITGYTIDHFFAGPTSDGANPRHDAMTPVATPQGLMLFGTTLNGGAHNNGSIFEIGEDGSNYQRLHDFTGGSSDGAKPIDNVILVGGYLYGLTTSEGQYNDGMIFQVAVP